MRVRTLFQLMFNHFCHFEGLHAPAFLFHLQTCSHARIPELNSLCVLCRVSSRDTGKTMVDASLGEIMTTCEKITWLLDEGEKWLKPEYRSESPTVSHPD
jgi:hypothetical protein